MTVQFCNLSANQNASAQVTTDPVVYGGYVVQVATATAAILIRAGGASGQIIDSIAASSGVGAKSFANPGIRCPAGVYFDLNGGTGTVALLLG